MRILGQLILLIGKIYVVIIATLLGLIGITSAMIQAATP